MNNNKQSIIKNNKQSIIKIINAHLLKLHTDLGNIPYNCLDNLRTVLVQSVENNTITHNNFKYILDEFAKYYNQIKQKNNV